MKHRGLKFLSLLLTLVVLLGVLPGVTAWAEDPPTNGDCGDNGGNVKWDYNTTTKTLTISGTGAMMDFNSSNPWDDFTSQIKTVVITDGVTSIGEYAFYSCTSLTSVVIPNSVTTIGDAAFGTCTSLSRVTIPNSVTTIGNSAFFNCRSLTSVVIPGSVTSISGYAFSYCPNLTSVSIPGSVTSIGDGAFSSCDNLASISIPGSVTSIGVLAFSTCGKLASITFEPGAVSELSISQYAFSFIDSTAQFGSGSAELRDGNGNKIETFDALADMLWNSTITVNRELASYTMTFKPGEGATGDDQQLSATAGADYQLPKNRFFTAPEGKVFAGWKDTKTGTVYKELDIIPNVEKNYTFEAQWKPASQGGDSGSGSGGVDLVFNIPGADNSWEYVGGGYAPQYAYRVSLAPMQGGSAALGLMTGDSGTALNVYPTSTVYVFPNAEPGYVLDKIVWSLIDGSASYDITEAKNFVMPAMDVVVYVTFRPVG